MGINVSVINNITQIIAFDSTVVSFASQSASILIITIGALVLIILAGVVIYYFWKKHRRGRNSRRREEKILARLIEKGLVPPGTCLPNGGNEVIESIKL